METGLSVGTCLYQDVVNDPRLPRANGLKVTYDEIVALYPSDQEPIYRSGYQPSEDEARDVLPLSQTAVRRFIDYYNYFDEEEHRGANDCFSLAAHLSSGQPLDTICGQGLRYESRGSVEFANTRYVAPGALYFMGTLATMQVRDINHWMIGVGKDRVLARWGQRSDAALGIGTTSLAAAIYGGQLFRLRGELYRDDSLNDVLLTFDEPAT